MYFSPVQPLEETKNSITKFPSVIYIGELCFPSVGFTGELYLPSEAFTSPGSGYSPVYRYATPEIQLSNVWWPATSLKATILQKQTAGELNPIA